MKTLDTTLFLGFVAQGSHGNGSSPQNYVNLYLGLAVIELRTKDYESAQQLKAAFLAAGYLPA